MSLEDEDVPLHRIDPVKDRARLVAEALAHAEAQEAQHRIRYEGPGPGGGNWKTPAALGVFLVAILLWAFPPAWTSPAAPATPGAGELERGLRVALYLQARQIEAFRARNGRLPRSLDELPVRFGGLGFVRSNNRVYQLIGQRPNGAPLVYDSAHPPPGVDRTVAAWLGIASP